MGEQVALPEGQEFFKLNEVCKIANVQPYMLRFWGTEFAQLEAAKSGTGQRLYTRDQVEVILEIRRLLFDEGLTIAGARKRVGAMQEQGSLPTPGTAAQVGDVAAAAAPGEPAPEPPVEVEPVPPVDPAPFRLSSAEVDKRAGERVQPLLATLKDVRTEVAKIVADLKTRS